MCFDSSHLLSLLMLKPFTLKRLGLLRLDDPCPGPSQIAFLLSGVTVCPRLRFLRFHLNVLESAISSGSPGSFLVGTGN